VHDPKETAMHCVAMSEIKDKLFIGYNSWGNDIDTKKSKPSMQPLTRWVKVAVVDVVQVIPVDKSTEISHRTNLVLPREGTLYDFPEPEEVFGTITVIGSLRIGKSTTLNRMAGKDVFLTKATAKSVTTGFDRYKVFNNGTPF